MLPYHLDVRKFGVQMLDARYYPCLTRLVSCYALLK